MRVRRDTTIKGVCVLGDHLNGMLAKRLIESKDFLKRCCAANVVFVCCLDFLLGFGSSDDSALKYEHHIFVLRMCHTDNLSSCCLARLYSSADGGFINRFN